jgi:sporulation protein YlmC with PRC-barrel domain
MSTATKALGDWTGRQVLDTAGDKIGTVQDVRYDDAVDQPKWLVVKAGLFGTKKIFVPARDVRAEGEKLMVPYTEDRVKDAPPVAKDNVPSLDEERELYLYYGLEFEERMPAGTSAEAPTTGAMDTQAPTAPTSPTGAPGDTEGKWGPGLSPNEQEEVLSKRRDQ